MRSGKIDLWQGRHKMGEKSSEIVHFGAPFFPTLKIRAKGSLQINPVSDSSFFS
jgi:hypothetical protein